ncbi:MAG: cytochrome c biogenesis protein CcdA [Promethearchaeia archaeon]
MEVNFLVAFLAGLVIGATPCILLMLSAFGSSLILRGERKNFINISLGLLSGFVLGYIFISIIFLFFVPMFEMLYYFKYIFAGILIFIGIWQILDYKNEDSRVFSTPQKVKSVLKNFIKKRTGTYALLVGIIFVFIKMPCFGGVYLSLLYNLHKNPLLYVFIMWYIIGMLMPITLILILLRLGLKYKKINNFRLKYRPYLRLLSGGVLVFLAIYLLI